MAPNPKDSMKSTWRTASKGTWGFSHWLMDFSDAYPTNLNQAVPKHEKTEKIPYMSQSSQHIWVLYHAFIPLALHQLYMSWVDHASVNKWVAFFYYFNAFNLILIRESHTIRYLGHKYGFLDGDVHDRDGIPDVGVGKIAMSIFKGTGARMAMAVYFTFEPTQAPLDVMTNWKWWAWLFVEIGLYGVILDFWFYWYHRAMHDVPFLWKFHRTHHLTKHPNPLMTAYADEEQEFFDLAGIPLMTFFTLRAIGLPLGFYEWWICHQYIAFIEVAGHSGLRIHAAGLSTFHEVLKYFDAEIVIEDHDLHHRKGWRNSYNYGKQTRLWDRVFGTVHERIESTASNVDYTNVARLPLLLTE